MPSLNEKDRSQLLLDKKSLAEIAEIKELVYHWEWQDLKDIKVLLPLDIRRQRPTIFFELTENKKVPHFIIEDEPCNVVEGGTHI